MDKRNLIDVYLICHVKKHHYLLPDVARPFRWAGKTCLVLTNQNGTDRPGKMFPLCKNSGFAGEKIWSY